VKGERESMIHFHIARLDADADRQKLIEGLAKTLNREQQIWIGGSRHSGCVSAVR